MTNLSADENKEFLDNHFLSKGISSKDLCKISSPTKEHIWFGIYVETSEFKTMYNLTNNKWYLRNHGSEFSFVSIFYIPISNKFSCYNANDIKRGFEFEKII